MPSHQKKTKQEDCSHPRWTAEVFHGHGRSRIAIKVCQKCGKTSERKAPEPGK